MFVVEGDDEDNVLYPTFSKSTALYGYGGNDLIYGTLQMDNIYGGSGVDTMIGGASDDLYFVDTPEDVVIEAAGKGIDWIFSHSLSYALPENVEDLMFDYIRTTVRGDVTFWGNGLNNRIGGWDGNDSIWGLGGNDSIRGYAGNDVIDGGAGNDSMDGGAGDDMFYVDNARDVVIEASNGGTDLVYSYCAAYTLTSNVESGAILSVGIANLTGNGLNNTLYAGSGNNVLNGGTGTDTASYANAAAGVSVSLAVSIAQATGGSGSDTLIAIENLTGSAWDDVLTGSSANNVINGGAGNDILKGGLGNDTLVGDAGRDIFLFNTALGAGNVDNVADFVAADDAIHLDDAIFAALAAGGELSPDAFCIGTAAADASDRIIYDSVSGDLWYDSDGTGGIAAVKFAKLVAVTGMVDHTDFIVV